MTVAANKMIKVLYSTYPISTLRINDNYYRNDRYYQLAHYLYNQTYSDESIGDAVSGLNILELFNKSHFLLLCDLVENGGMDILIDFISNMIKERRRGEFYNDNEN